MCYSQPTLKLIRFCCVMPIQVCLMAMIYHCHDKFSDGNEKRGKCGAGCAVRGCRLLRLWQGGEEDPSLLLPLGEPHRRVCSGGAGSLRRSGKPARSEGLRSGFGKALQCLRSAPTAQLTAGPGISLLQPFSLLLPSVTLTAVFSSK